MIDSKTAALIDLLEERHCLSLEDYKYLVEHESRAARDYIAPKARRAGDSVYGKDIFVRGLIEFSNYCKNNCYYCGIRAGNKECDRYRLTEDEILACCRAGYEYGYRTFVLQSGEDLFYTDDKICSIVSHIKEEFPDCAVTLSIGEKSYETYKSYRLSGADRFLLRHETADRDHYQMIHPSSMSWDRRMQCEEDLKDLGFSVGIGMMVGSPRQTSVHLAKDLKYIEEFRPQMVGMGPFIPHAQTPFGDKKAGSLEMTLYLLSIVRLILPDVLLPATTALGTIHPQGREMGVLAGANVVMPNLSPYDVREKYQLYNNKLSGAGDSAQNIRSLKSRMTSIGYKIVTDRGDIRRKTI